MTEPSEPLRTSKEFHPNGGGVAEGGGSRLGVFARHWTPGETKTRLAASVGDGPAAAVARDMLMATLHRCSTIGAERFVAFTPPQAQPAFLEIAQEISGQWRCVAQPGGPLGDRMRRYLSGADAAEPGATILIGSDSPDLPLEALREALSWLACAGRRFVLGPASDGGYWLIGAKGELPPVFDDMPWGSARVYSLTVSRLIAAGWREGVDFRTVTPWYDIDRLDALNELRVRLCRSTGDGALSTLQEQLTAILGPPSASTI
ncbi:TIGR04282 family arsenosugar biosynthesis glycosyltransferase [Botrimarina hoheduenensis]|uniref:2-phospho-L-lactate guanylyltransferase n=1 Tax=Botrimarina hoheduenensis TaxID=2528000 RepID=A0A5C5VVD4_9BACT|nr:TIGR04282 family arsenosugar biosynthesis glycosyltransferase [Botrimarina hoheduenensis]TWT41629.1 hypothetical protein Pla111_30060 [Botrimarina hoheduenensis]